MDVLVKDRARRLLAVNAALVESDAEKLLLEWFEQWEDREEMPVKMDNALHIRTSMYFVEKQHRQAIADATDPP